MLTTGSWNFDFNKLKTFLSSLSQKFSTPVGRRNRNTLSLINIGDMLFPEPRYMTLKSQVQSSKHPADLQEVTGKCRQIEKVFQERIHPKGS